MTHEQNLDQFIVKEKRGHTLYAPCQITTPNGLQLYGQIEFFGPSSDPDLILEIPIQAEPNDRDAGMAAHNIAQFTERHDAELQYAQMGLNWRRSGENHLDCSTTGGWGNIYLIIDFTDSRKRFAAVRKMSDDVKVEKFAQEFEAVTQDENGEGIRIEPLNC